MSSSPAKTTSAKDSPGGCQKHEWLFINSTSNAERLAQKRKIRAQAARASSNARVETIRRRAEDSQSCRQPGRCGLPLRLTAEPEQKEEPLPRNAVEQHQSLFTKYRDRETSVTLHSHTLLGGSIPLGQANAATLAKFLHRFNVGTSVERPWVELVLAEATSSTTRTLTSTALMANASALCANDLQAPDMRRHATKLYLSTLGQLQSSLKSPNWRDSMVMYTCMILTLYECIESNLPSARLAHVKGVAYLIQQKGPLSFKSGLEHKTFRYFRINILLACLSDRQSCFLAEEGWKTIPFSGDCPPKTLLDLLLDILVEIPGVLAAGEAMRNGDLSRYALIQKAFELTLWVRRLTYNLERWKEEDIWTYPTMCTARNLKSLDLITLCELGTGLSPYDVKLAEALNLYVAAHLILARIAQRLAERSFVFRSALHPPYALRDLVAAIVLVSERHVAANITDMVSMVVTTFPLKVAQMTTELQEPELLENVRVLLDLVNGHFAKRYNINYAVAREGGAYGV
ncbi:hypothetical protein M409DRAFT_23187 [Zasmidium cellare ATCC 36951]|uniref:Transcription factor domain-containing protein n=1 Tax=Zasmidium cellare ATCC 36951 TaxID=1080233 RepID=A0A6A6CHM6_ZASCE|nr:uncharacterized protein M409DRAFT_23187 [Zasmidium cellare ATCC 36951]KAF2166551.1 hypothetical protein M409DRAFT_23187 [Zasmidium cellare ATCC 36951]